MSVKINHEKKTVSLGVGDILDGGRGGAAQGISFFARTALGREAHTAHQDSQADLVAGYRREVFVRYETAVDGFAVKVQGRIDGVYVRGAQTVVEEIKSVVKTAAQWEALSEKSFPQYVEQLRLYCFFVTRSEGAVRQAVGAGKRKEKRSVFSVGDWRGGRLSCPVVGHLVLLNVVDGAKKEFAFAPPFEDVEELIVERVRALLAVDAAQRARLEASRDVSKRIVFPFLAPRPHQDQMIASVERALQNGKHLMVCAPSGIGKTAGALFPAIKFALANGKRVFFATAKNTQQELAWETIGKISSVVRGSADPAQDSAAGFQTGTRQETFGRANGEVGRPSPNTGKIFNDTGGDACASESESAPRRSAATTSPIPPFSHSPIPFSALRLRAKEQMCINEVYACHEEFCPQLRQVTEKLAAHDVMGRLQQKPMSDPDWLMELGRAVRLCPFDLAMLRSEQADVVVCDYNYIFDPAVYLRHFFEENAHDDCVLIIDEAHNLYGRAMEYYSPSLRRADVRACLGALPFDEALAEDLAAWLRSLEKFFTQLRESGEERFGEEKKFPVALPRAFFYRKRDEAEKLAMRYFIYRFGQRRAAVEDPIKELFTRFFAFVHTLELAETDEPQLEDEFSFLFDRTEAQQIKILCKDPSRLLRKRLDGFHSVIAMSATLEPMEFYREVLGFDAKRTEMLRLPSPFARENRKVLVVPTISTTFRARDRSYERLAKIITDVVAQRHGNYAVFFPSYEYLRQTEMFLRPLIESRTYGAELIVQERGMSEQARGAVMTQLREEARGKIVLAVQGGIFAEGVDFARETLIGVIVVSPALPTFDFERELLRNYYERKNGQGFEYAYLYPGMTRVIQAVGRLIRAETDRGVAVLICSRFAQRQYAALFPREWYGSEAEELVTRDVAEDVRRFWEEGGVGNREE
jgi:Rad3-related DNA helicase